MDTSKIVTTTSLDPAEPMFRKLAVTANREYARFYGPCHIYNYDPYAEIRPGATPEEQNHIKMNYAKSIAKIIQDTDPQGRWFASGWAFVDEHYWPKKSFENFVNLIPPGMFCVSDSIAEINPLYKKYNYFYGKDWLFGILHTFGKKKGLYGDAANLIKQLKDVASDPHAKNCKGVYPNPESICHNILYFDLAGELAWNPNDVELEKFLKNYAVRRYGEKSAGNMVKVLYKLVETVYGRGIRHSGGSEALYQTRLGAVNPKIRAGRDFFISKLRRSLETMLAEYPNQENNPLFENDLIDITRQYLIEMFNHYLVKMYLAFQGQDQESFQMESKMAFRCLDGIADAISTHRDYRLSELVEHVEGLPGADDIPPQFLESILSSSDPSMVDSLNIERMVKSEFVYLDDYARTDYYELIKFYYRKRVEAYVNCLREKMNEKITTVSAAELEPIYDRLRDEWMREPLRTPEKFRDTPAEAVEAILKQFPVSGI